MAYTRFVFLTLCLFFMFPPIALRAQEVNTDSAQRAWAAIKIPSARIKAISRYQQKILTMQPKLALELGNKILALSVEHRFDSGITMGYSAIINAYMSFNDYPNALQNCNLMLKAAENNKETESQILAYLRMSDIYQITGELNKNPKEWELATGFIEKALAISRKHAPDVTQGDILSALGIQYDLRKMHAKAVETLRQAVALAQSLKDSYGEVTFNTNLGIALKNNQQLEGALAAYTKALPIARTNNFGNAEAALLDNMAILYYEMKNPVLAEQYALQSIALSQQLHFDPPRVDAYGLLVKHYKRQGQFEQALEYSLKEAALKDSMFNAQKSAQLKSLQVQYDTELKDQTIEKQTTQIAFNTKRSLYLWTGIALLLLVAAAIFIIQRRTAQLNKRITAQGAELSAQKQQLQEANAVKDRLFSVISHDLRTPVNSLLTLSMMLGKNNIRPEKMNQYTGMLQKDLGHTAGLLENLLNFAKSQMGGYKPHLENFSIGDVATDTIPLLQPTADAKQITIDNQTDPNAKVYADASMTALIIRNLVGNAIKYSQPGGLVTLSTQHQNGQVLLLVKDNGTGMDASLMQTFNNTIGTTALDSTPGTLNEKGTGLGLMLCKNFVALMGGKLWVESGLGKGSCFMLQLTVDN